MEDICQAITLNPAAAEPIYQQLQNQLRRVIADLPDGTRLPAERLMAEKLGIARNTLKAALNQLVGENRIVRRGYQGSFVHRPKPEAAKPAATTISLRPYLANRKISRKPLRLMLFEDYPTQRIFWNRTVELFNQSSRGVTIERIVGPDVAATDITELEDFVTREQVDMLQISRFPAYGRVTATLSPELRHRLADSSEFMTELFSPQPQPLEGRLVPVYTNFYSCYYNRTVLTKYGIDDLAKRWYSTDHFALLRDLRREIPEGEYLIGSIISLVLAQGFGTDNIETLLPFWRELRATAHDRIYRPVYPQDMHQQLEATMRHKQSMFIDWSLTAMQKFSDLGFEPGSFPLQPQPGRRALGSGSYLAIVRFSPRYAEAHEFLDFMLSGETQQRICDELNVVPYSRNAARYLHRVFPDFPESWWTDTLKQYTACDNHEWSEFLSIPAADNFREIQGGHIDEMEAMRRTRAQWPLFLERKQRELEGIEAFSLYSNLLGK